MDKYRALILLGVGAVGAMAVLFGMDAMRGSVATQDHALYVDPLIDKQNLFITGRVTVQNVGGKDLTNVVVDFGDGDKLSLGTLESGKKVIVSPPPDNAMEYVMVSADPGVFVSKAYREPPKMVGMMGS